MSRPFHAIISASASEPCPSAIRRSAFIQQAVYLTRGWPLTLQSAVQSERFKVLDGVDETSFEVPIGLLITCSPFLKLYHSIFKETTERRIYLP